MESSFDAGDFEAVLGPLITIRSSVSLSIIIILGMYENAC